MFQCHMEKQCCQIIYIYVCKASCAFFYCFENIMKELSLYYLNDVYWQFAKENKNNGGFL